ncbi:MAG: hypothetical protein HOV79_34800 [Hamadaea sp.]|nr:hypothetical protein [Hamadaea sp.]
MSRISRLWASLVVSLLTVLALPGVAWASESDLVRRRPRGMGFFGFSALCCIVVVAVIVVAVVMISRNRKR